MNEETLETPSSFNPEPTAPADVNQQDANHQAQATAEAAADYNPENVDILRDAAHIRARPGMYIGDTSSKGLHHLVYELVYNSVDEALAGFCHNIHVKINDDGSLSVTDDGRGIPVDIHPKVGRPTLEVVLTTVGAGAKFDKRTYKTSAGLHGMGAKAVTALSDWTEAEVRRGGKVYVQEYERGHATTDVKELGTSPGNRTGTKVTFHPDPEIFHDAKFDYDTLENRLRELAFLNKETAIKLTDALAGKEETFAYKGGVAQFVEWLNHTEETFHKTLYVDKTVDDVRVEIAFQYTTGEEERVRCYANNAHNPGGGTHLSGFRAALTRALNTYGEKNNLFKNNLKTTGDDFREGITGVVSIQVPEPQFESQTKIRLNNPEVEGIVGSVLHEYLAKFLEENPKEAAKIMKKVILAAEAREAAAKAKKALKDRKSILSGGGLPGKLMDCTSRDRDESELFLVEGQSAGGSADNGRDRVYQAVLPLRGKVLNVEKARVEKVLDNAELVSLISAVGIDIGNTEDIERLRYGKIIILTDADVDGQHIRTLILTFFYRQMRPLVEGGYVYVARPPLFKVEQKKNVRYVQTLEEMARELQDRGIAGSKLIVAAPEGEVSPTRERVFEGEQLKALINVLDEIEGALVILERRGFNIASMLSRIKDGKLPTFRVLLGKHEHWFFTMQEVDRFRAEKVEEGRELLVPDDETPAVSNGVNGHHEIFSYHELHELKTVNRGLEKLRAFDLQPGDLVPAPRIAGREPAPRFFLESDDHRQMLEHLRVLGTKVRKIGEKGIKVVRFKGLGEMDGDELWDTTLNPATRTLLKVQLEDALKADEMFRILMGEKVEPRREFIQKHALEVKEIDYHGA
jgi:DNA gyrase subunit B